MQNREFELHFQNATLPPPYANQLTITIRHSGTHNKVEFEQEYLYRDDITLEDVQQEGFPLLETIKWKGELPDDWFDATDQLFDKTTLIQDENKIAKREPKIWIKKNKDGIQDEGMPDNTNSWEDHIQDLIQAVYEKAEMEKPLTLRILSMDENQKKEIKLTPSFIKREIYLEITNNQQPFTRKKDWPYFKSIAKLIFTLDYFPEKSTTKPPHSKGLYIDPGDGLYYKANTGAVEIDKKNQTFEKIAKLLSEL